MLVLCADAPWLCGVVWASARGARVQVTAAAARVSALPLDFRTPLLPLAVSHQTDALRPCSASRALREEVKEMTNLKSGLSARKWARRRKTLRGVTRTVCAVAVLVRAFVSIAQFLQGLG